jgi:hypothetical protein
MTEKRMGWWRDHHPTFMGRGKEGITSSRTKYRGLCSLSLESRDRAKPRDFSGA